MATTERERSRHVGTFVSSISREALTLLALLVCGSLAGCSLYGITSRFALKVEQSPASPPTSRVEFGSFAVAPEAVKVIAVGSFEWGAFSRRDGDNLSQSIVDTLKRIDWPATTDPGANWKIHVVLRRHVVAHSNNSGATLAIVAWCLSSGHGLIVHEEQFYSCSSGSLITTIGWEKDAVNKAIVRRIVESALRLASSESLPPPAPNTYNTIGEAAAVLPKGFCSVDVIFPGLPVPTAYGGVDWKALDAWGRVNWWAAIRSSRADKL